MQPPPESTPRYQCPGEANEISRSVHLGRLASFYPACRTCACNTDTGLLPPSHLKQLSEVFAQAPVESLLFDEGLVGIDPTDINAHCIRKAASAFAHTLENRGDLQARRGPVLIGYDERPTPAELMAAAAEGLRMENVDVLEVGPATSASITHAMQTLSACGGMLLGNARSVRREVSMKFWTTAGAPLSAGQALTELEAHLKSGVPRTARSSGTISRTTCEGDYLAALAPGFHALRPLQVGIDCSNTVWWRHLELLAGNVACQFLPTQRNRSLKTPQTLTDAGAHDFLLWVDGDGEACRVWDEQGQPVSATELLCLLALRMLREQGGGTLLVSGSLPAKMRKQITRCGGTIKLSPDNSREAIHAMMQQTGAILGCDTQNRFWFNTAGPIPDSLQMLSLLLNVLSETDAPLSERVAQLA